MAATTEALERPAAPAVPGAELSAAVLAILTTLSEEMHPHQKGRVLGLEGDLDRNFGLDSLGRVEAIHRLEAAFNVTLPDRLFAEAAAPADLVRAVAEANPTAAPRLASRSELRAPSGATAAPETLGTLCDVLAWHAARHPDRPHAYLSDGDREEAPITYAALLQRARRVAAGLAAKGVEPGARIALMLPTGADFFAAFLGVLMAGAAPAPIYPPWRMLRIEDHLRRQARILATAGASGLVTFAEARPFARLLEAHVPTLAYAATVEELEREPPAAAAPAPRPDDLALLQFTSGSTADPKGVMLSHANVLANVRGIAQAIRATPEDVLVSWLPLYHDMGLIAAWLACLDQAVPFVVMSPLSFMARPERWLWTAHRNRATITAAPNFAYELCLSIPEARLQGLDLSALRVAGCGSEPVSTRTMADFIARFAPYGFRPEAFLPVYGLAESAAALTIPPLGRPPRVDYVNRRALALGGEARVTGPDAPDAQPIVSCGIPLADHEVRILGPDGREAPERREGPLQFRGPSATRGYFNAPEKTADLVKGDWLDTGDLAYIAEGELFVTGRTKDIVKRAGRNIHPADVEAALASLPGVEPSGAVLFNAFDPRGVEKLVIALETGASSEADRNALVSAAQELAADHLESAVDDIVLMSPGSIPRTESGKVRRPALREAYQRGPGEGRVISPRRQVLRLQATAFAGRVRRWRQRALDWLYAKYWWATLGLVGVVAYPLALFLPSLHARWQAMHALAPLSLKLLGHRLTVTKEADLPAHGVVYVANHTSYLDHLALAAVLPGDLAFAAYKELADDPFQGPFVRKIGGFFVERFEPQGAAAEVTHALTLLEAGRPLVIYPEATIMRMPGVLDFMMGAFATAAQAGVPVVPVAIVGARNILRHDHRWFPRRGDLEVHVGPALKPAGADFEAALELRDQARSFILAHVREPDLAGQTPAF
ncbi:MAG TPA: AMP-binding protein [Caulobacteraceae bacterium]|nr:AMP-binding protein [Caulobacteraceae bacterium]